MADSPAKGVRSQAVLQSVERARFVLLRWEIALVAIVLVGGGLRVHGLDWDQYAGGTYPQQMHPDERFLSIVSSQLDWPSGPSEYFDTDASPLNPYNGENINAYVYGTFPLFTVKALATAADRGAFTPLEWAGFAVPAGDPAGTGNGYDQTVVWGRALTSIVDTLTILLVFAAGAVLFGRIAALIGAGGYALAVLPTQIAHFFTMDPFVTFFAVATVLLCALWVTGGSRRRSFALMVGIGVCVGLGLASKVTAWPLVMLPVLATGLRLAHRDLPSLGLRWQGRTAPVSKGSWSADIGMLALALLLGAIVFRIAQPYAFATPDFSLNPFATARSLFEFNPVWRADLEREISFQNGDADYPPFVQFAGATPFLTPLRNMLLWGMGPAIGVAALVGAATAALAVFKRRELAVVLPLALALSIFGFQGPRFVAFMRYFAPLYPMATLLAGWAAVEAWNAINRRPVGESVAHSLPGFVRHLPGFGRTRVIHLRRAAIVTGVAVSLGAAFWAFAFQNIYVEQHPRLQASEWLFANATPGSTVTGEYWDDTIPYPKPGVDSGAYRVISLDIYTTDSEEKIRELVYGAEGTADQGLDAADYVAVTSNRVRDSVTKLEREYPATIRYYELLESGRLGFELAAHFEVRPSLFGIRINDATAEESFTVYDHPEVRIYRKTAEWDPDRAFALLMAAYPERAMNLLPRQGATNGLQFTADEAQTQREGGTFTDVFDADGFASKVPWLWWLLIVEAAAFATLPWLTWLFRALPDRGYGLSKPVGLAAWGVLTWLAVAWGFVQFSGALAWATLSVQVIAALVVGWMRRGVLREEASSHWRGWLASELVFLGAFALFLLIRANNPDLWWHPLGGEKPMDLAYLTAVTRSTVMPPYDPWFAGGTMNYYYMGWFLLAVPLRALRILPEVGFNLGVATYGAFTASVAFSAGLNLIGVSARRSAGHVRGFGGRGAIAGGIVGALLMVGLGNLDGGHQMIERVQSVNTWGAMEGMPVLGGAVGIAGGLKAWLFDGATLPAFDWWRSSRLHFDNTADIVEFPFWTYLFADLHPNLMGLPFFGLLIAISSATLLSAMRGLRAQGWVLAAALGVALGLVRTIHTWDFPTAAIIAIGAIVAGQVLAPGRWQTRLWTALGQLALMGAVYRVGFAPYLAHFEVFNAGIMRAPETTALQQYFAHFGVFIACLIAFLAVRYHEEVAARNREAGGNPALVIVMGWMELLSLVAFVVGLLALTWQFGYGVVAMSGVLLFFLANLLWLEFRTPERDGGRLLATAMFIAAVGIAAGVDLVTVKNDIVRMNTVFKFSLQAWQLYAFASAYAAWYVGRALFRMDGWLPRTRAHRGWSAAVVAGVAVVFVVGAAVFPFEGTKARQRGRFEDTDLTLDGLAFMQYGEYRYDRATPNVDDDITFRLADDRPLIDWLRNNVEGSPVIAEAVGPSYQWVGRVTMLTGLPAVVGWEFHQIQQRWDYGHLVQERRKETTAFYTTFDPATAAAYLRKYDVRYVVAGGPERAYGNADTIRQFETLPFLTKVFENGEDAIYAVDQSQLAVLP